MRKTKIVCTIGPACDSEETLRAMMLAGMNVARLNFSHGTHAEHQVRIDRIKKLRAELDLPIAIMLDTKGPEYRIGTFADGKIDAAQRRHLHVHDRARSPAMQRARVRELRRPRAEISSRATPCSSTTGSSP